MPRPIFMNEKDERRHDLLVAFLAGVIVGMISVTVIGTYF